MDLKTLPCTVLYAVARNRHRYGKTDQLDHYIKSYWFFEPLWKHMTGARTRLGVGQLSDEDSERVAVCQAFMREVCTMSDLDFENLLVSRSTLDAANYSMRVKGARLLPEPEKEFLERCKGKKSRMNALLMYCGKWEIMPENMTEVTIVAGFEGGRRGRIGANFLKKLAENKRKCRDLLAQIMKHEGIGEDEPIKRILERLG